jgi:hypothetical protein
LPSLNLRALLQVRAQLLVLLLALLEQAPVQALEQLQVQQQLERLLD